ncbi:DUF6036 family nucleotidyltransferase [Nitrosopumilus ureiphilus]|uniref:DUF6036 domain-containing protein n=1 Tax=Nitrosopumilus ureiphilus TaxID=1470067 RepID=A0A7D5M826_9ARCH|nr:DUF6036 family nucleotidyltransferase [Nitrosopumilus ureiphilus]QLH06770.1 hypothetical protein C5F50_06535 [Nitrosopumilus ureiphilus]
MSDRNRFGEEELVDALDSIGSKLAKKARVNMIGGCSMTFRGTKAATKDIDIVVKSTDEVKTLVKAMKAVGFENVKDIGSDYRSLGAWMVMERPDGMRFDIFDRIVCNALEISDTMESRAEFYKEFGNLKVYLMSPEDILLFKGITERLDDLEDMRILAEGGIDWKTVESECFSQKQAGRWADALASKLLELKSEYGIDSPIIKTMAEHGNVYVLEVAFSKVIGEKEMTTDEIIEEVKKKYNYSASWTRKQLKVLEERNFVTRKIIGKPHLYSINKKGN